MGSNKKLGRKVRNSYLISTFSISLVLFLLGGVGYLMATAIDVANRLQQSITATVELKEGVSDESRELIRRAAASYPVSGEVRFSSKEEKINNDEFREMFGLEFERILEDNPLMDSFEVSLAAKVHDVEELKEFAEAIGKMKGVERVSYPAVVVEQMRTTVGHFQIMILIFGGALLFISMVLLNNTIRMAIFSRRSLIRTMKLVGATKWFIVRPFLWSGLVSGFWAGCIAARLLGGALYGVSETLDGVITFAELERGAVVAGAMVAGGVVLSTLFTWISVSRFVNLKRNKIQLY